MTCDTSLVIHLSASCALAMHLVVAEIKRPVDFCEAVNSTVKYLICHNTPTPALTSYISTWEIVFTGSGYHLCQSSVPQKGRRLRMHAPPQAQAMLTGTGFGSGLRPDRITAPAATPCSHAYVISEGASIYINLQGMQIEDR